MAKINHILFGQGKGKVGGLVLQRYEGLNVVREKPISVKNPQSTKQMEQRAKFKLATQVTAQFKEVFLARLSPISSYIRTRRAASVNAIVKIIGTATPESPQALIDDVIAAIDAKNVSAIAGPTLGGGASGNPFTIVGADGDTVVYVCCGYDEDGTLKSREANSYTSDGTSKEVDNANLDVNILMAVSLHPLTENGRATLNNTHADTTKFAINIARAVAAGDVEVSNLSSRVTSA